MSNTSDFALVGRWESALSRSEELYSDCWGIAYRSADPQGWEGYGEDDAVCNARHEFESAASDYCIGALCLDFPQSTHGDARVVSAYVLPGGTTVLILFATYEVEEPFSHVYTGRDFEAMLEVAHSLLFDTADYGEIQNLDENPDYDPDVYTTYEGENALKRAWIDKMGGEVDK